MTLPPPRVRPRSGSEPRRSREPGPYGDASALARPTAIRLGAAASPVSTDSPRPRPRRRRDPSADCPGRLLRGDPSAKSRRYVPGRAGALAPVSDETARAALEALAAQNAALATALRATPRDATVAAAELRVLEARLNACRRDYEQSRRAHAAEISACRLEMRGFREQADAERATLLARLKDEALTVHELTKRCDVLVCALEEADVLPSALSGGARRALRASRAAARTLDLATGGARQITPEQPGFPEHGSREAFADLLDSNQVLLRELGVR